MNGQVPAIDYTGIGYTALRAALLDLARQRLPEWTDTSPNDLGVLLLELMAYAGDITLYYQTRIAANLLPATSDEPDALVRLLRLIGYELKPPAPATANLTVAFDGATPTPISIPATQRFTVTLPAGTGLDFETERPLVLQAAVLTPPDAANLRYYYPVPVVQGRTYTDQVGVSDGSPNQMYTILRSPVIDKSVSIVVHEPGPIDTRWIEVQSLANSSPADRHFVVQRDAAGAATLIFGDGYNGMRPPPSTPGTQVGIDATYRQGGSSQGNVPANSTFVPVNLPGIKQAINPQAAAGGTEQESADRGRIFAPRLYRTQERAVSQSDHVDLALLVPGVGKALAVPAGWNEIVLYIAPSGQVAEPSEILKADVLAFFETHRMAATQMKIVGPQPADIYLGAVVRAQPYFLRSQVQARVEAAVADYLSFGAVDFGQSIYLSRVYDVIQNLAEVASLTIFKFSRKPELPVNVHAPDVETDEVIVLDPFELPRPGYRDNPDHPPVSTMPDWRPPIYTVIEGGVSGR